MKPEIVFLERNSFERSVQFELPQVPHVWKEYPTTLKNQIVDRSQQAEIIIVNKLELDSKTISQLPKLKLIAVTATGTNNIDLEYCDEKKVKVINVSNYGTPSIVEHTFLLILALRRKLLYFTKAVKEKKWNTSPYFCYYDPISDFPILELNQSRLGIIGAGIIGQAVGQLGEAMGMKVFYFNRSKRTDLNDSQQISWNEIISSSDILSLHLPLTEQTKNLITLKELKMMKPSAILINTSRGGIVNENDLVEALQKKYLSGIGFDVLSKEPPIEGNPLLNLADEPNVIITPHVAWTGQQSTSNLMRLVIEKIENFLKGKPVSFVNS